MYTHTYLHTYIHTHTHTHTYIHTYTHTYTHTHELSKITAWAKNYKIEFNDDKSTAMLVSRRRRKERKEINVFLNYKLLKQVNKIKYLGIIMDNKFKFREHIT
jgi:hypothetical protein